MQSRNDLPIGWAVFGWLRIRRELFHVLFLRQNFRWFKNEVLTDQWSKINLKKSSLFSPFLKWFQGVPTKSIDGSVSVSCSFTARIFATNESNYTFALSCIVHGSENPDRSLLLSNLRRGPESPSRGSLNQKCLPQRIDSWWVRPSKCLPSWLGF